MTNTLIGVFYFSKIVQFIVVMVKLAVIIFHSGQWDERQCYMDYKTNSVLVDGVISSFNTFVNLICIEQVESCVELSILLPIGSNDVQHVLKVVEDKYVT